MGLGYDMSNSDGARWHRRSVSFLDALKQGDLKSTYQHSQPGVTLMWLNAGILQVTKMYPYLEDSQKYPLIDRNARVAVVIVLAILLIFQVWAVKRIFGHETSLFYMFFVSVEPFLIGIDRWMHLTSLETYFGFASFLFLLLWMKEKKSIVLVISSLFLSLGVLSKLTTFSLLPLFLVFIVVSQIDFKNIRGDLSRGVLARILKSVLLFSIVFILGAFIFFPALWVAPGYVINEFVHSVTRAVSSDVRGQYFTGILSYLYYFIVLGLKLSPITLILLVFGGVFYKKLVKQLYLGH